MSAIRERVISTEEIQFNHKPAKILLAEKRRESAKNGQTPSIIGICSYYVLDRPVFERCQTLLHPELTPWWSFLLDDGAHHKKPHSPTHSNFEFRNSSQRQFLCQSLFLITYTNIHTHRHIDIDYIIHHFFKKYIYWKKGWKLPYQDKETIYYGMSKGTHLKKANIN